MCGVYQIKNKVDGKVYVGSSVNIERRWKSHISELNKGCHNNAHLQNAWNKYGENVFEFSILELTTREDLRSRENYYLQLLRCTDRNIGYNMLSDTNVGLGVRASDEVRQKISAACSGKLNGNYGRKHTEEELQRMRDARWGVGYVKKQKVKLPRKEMPAEWRRKQSERMKNRVVTPETRQRMSEAAKRRVIAQSTRDKMSESKSGTGNPRCKLSREQVLEIYEKMNAGVNYKLVCAEYGIGQCQAYKIKRKEHWVFNDKE